jgi:hypothetical protein
VQVLHVLCEERERGREGERKVNLYVVSCVYDGEIAALGREGGREGGRAGGTYRDYPI